jgi:radical SAM protein with 4Fe4S-binding SPASM domain
VNTSNKKTFCSLLWTHQFIDPTGRVKPCCRFLEKERPKSHNINSKTLKEIFSSDWMINLRKKSLEGFEIEGCQRCYQEEKASKKSLRERYNNNSNFSKIDNYDTEDPDLKWLELSISNECNLACRMCDSRYSRLWFNEEKRLFGKTFSKERNANISLKSLSAYHKSLTHLKFTGGEPLIIDEQWKLLQELVSSDNSQSIFLNYSSNCTIFPSSKQLDIWNKFKFIELALSFDSCLKNEWEYIRWPSKQERMIKVMNQFFELNRQKNIHIIMRATVSILNVWTLPETLNYWLERDTSDLPQLNPTHLTYPDFLSITVLPKKIKQKINDKYRDYIPTFNGKAKNSLEYILNYMNHADHSSKLPDLERYITLTDKSRKQCFMDSYPYFEGIFDN